MSVGKYSPFCPHANTGYEFKYNCYGKEPAPWSPELAAAGVVYDEKTMFDDYDEEGYDRYGYSCFDIDGEYVGLGSGVDRAGKTESDYLCESMDAEDSWNECDYDD